MIVIGIGDTHVGSALGLWKPGSAIQEGGGYEPNKFQAWLWNCWQELLFEALSLREAHPGEEIVAVVNGDIIQGSHEKDGQLVTGRADLQALAALDLLQDLRELVDAMYLLHGTGWHGGPASCYVRPIAKQLDVVPNPQTGDPIWWELYLDVAGHLTHWTHHVGATSLPFYEATAPLRDFYVLEAELVRVYGHQAPGVELQVRSHRHRCIHVIKPPSVNCLVLPCWQLKGEFGFKVGAASLPDIGYGILRSTGRDLVVTPRVFELPGVHIEKRKTGDEASV